MRNRRSPETGPGRQQSQLVADAVVDGRRSLVLFVLAEFRSVPLEALTPQARREPRIPRVASLRRLLSATRRAAPGIAVTLLPLMVLALASYAGGADRVPGWITWSWAMALSAVNAIFLLIGPRLWNSLITAAIAIDEVVLDVDEHAAIAEWLRAHYVPRWFQSLVMLLGGLVGAGLLWWIDAESEYALTIGPGEYSVMFVTAALATSGLWILWWIAGIVPVLRRQKSMQLHWNNPARTPAIVFLNRALWKVAAAISVGMVCLAVAALGEPLPFTTGETTSTAWVVSAIAEFTAFAIVAVIFVRDGVWAQWQVFSLVRHHIDNAWSFVQERLDDLSQVYRAPGRKQADEVLYYAELDRHFDGLRTVDLKLGWALAWATSIFGAGASVVATAFTVAS